MYEGSIFNFRYICTPLVLQDSSNYFILKEKNKNERRRRSGVPSTPLRHWRHYASLCDIGIIWTVTNLLVGALLFTSWLSPAAVDASRRRTVFCIHSCYWWCTYLQCRSCFESTSRGCKHKNKSGLVTNADLFLKYQ